MDKKISDLTEKTTPIGVDSIELFDSEELVISEQNKKVQLLNLVKGIQSFGTWTVESPAGKPTLTSTLGRYVKTGVQVLLSFKFTVANNSDGDQVTLDAIPFTGVSGSMAIGMSLCIESSIEQNNSLQISSDGTQIQFHNVVQSLPTWPWQEAANFVVFGSITYITDEFV
ncbi:MAG: hypothetical protein IID16_00710 [Candidatus Marinimicrobia bacterium]|nr:hypothetical protein [Candidatus Neomarinimicrobiota bacterium]